MSQPSAPASEADEAASGQDAGPGRRLGAGLLIATLGVVYGDIGTSPLYALKEAVRAASPGGHPPPVAVTGAVSLILWALILVVSLKYAVLILRADNRGEGGIVAMLALLGARHAKAGSRQALLLIVVAAYLSSLLVLHARAGR